MVIHAYTIKFGTARENQQSQHQKCVQNISPTYAIRQSGTSGRKVSENYNTLGKHSKPVRNTSSQQMPPPDSLGPPDASSPKPEKHSTSRIESQLNPTLAAPLLDTSHDERMQTAKCFHVQRFRDQISMLLC